MEMNYYNTRERPGADWQWLAVELSWTMKERGETT